MGAPTAKERAIALSQSGFDHAAIGAILGINAEDVESLMTEANPQVVLPGAVKQAAVTFSHDEIIALSGGQQRVLIPAVPGVFVDVLRVQLLSRITAPERVYTNILAPATFVFFYGDRDYEFLTIVNDDPFDSHVDDLLGAGSDDPSGALLRLGPDQRWIESLSLQGPSPVLHTSFLADLSVRMKILNGGALTGGHAENTLTVVLSYVEVDAA